MTHNQPKENNTMNSPKAMSEAAKVIADRNEKNASKGGKEKTGRPARRNMTTDEARRVLEVVNQTKELIIKGLNSKKLNELIKEPTKESKKLIERINENAKRMEKTCTQLERIAKNALTNH